MLETPDTITPKTQVRNDSSKKKCRFQRHNFDEMGGVEIDLLATSFRHLFDKSFITGTWSDQIPDTW